MRGKDIAIYILIFALFVSGCATVKKIDIEDRGKPAEGMAHMVIYNEYKRSEFPLIVDGINKGTLTPSSPLFLQLKPGLHKIHTVTPGFVPDHQIAFNFKANSTYYFKIHVTYGFLTSIWIQPTEKVDSYLSNSKP